MKKLFDNVSQKTSRLVTNTYSTSFSMGIYCLHKHIHQAIYNIYAYVRLADEIVDSFHEFNKEELLQELKTDTFVAIEKKISLNPILNSFQQVVNEYEIDHELINRFLDSMEMDLHKNIYNHHSYDKYIYGSAEVVGLMCLKVFVNKDETEYNRLKQAAKKLGAAFQKVNFLRDLKDDYNNLGRIYFPGVNLDNFNEEEKKQVESDIESDFKEALVGIKQLPSSSKFGVYVAYVYYKALFNKIKAMPPNRILKERIRIPDYQKLALLFKSYFRHSLRLI